MSIKKTLIVLLVVALTASIVLVGCGKSGNSNNESTQKQESSTPKYTFRVSSNQPPEHPTVKTLYVFAEELNKRTNGQVEVKVYPAAQLGEETEVVEQAQQGILEFVRVSAGNVSSFAPKMDIFSVPYLFRDADHYWKVLNGEIGQEIFKDLENKQLKGLVYYDGGARSFYNRVKPIQKPEDLKGMKIRVMPSEVMLKTIEAFKAQPTTTSFSEVYSALQTGVIDGAENAPINLLTMKHYEVAPYFSLDEHMRIPDMLIMSLKKWNEMPPEIQKAIMDAAKASQEFQLKAWAEYEKKTMDELKAKGEKINTVDQAAFAEVVKPLIEELKPKFDGLIEKIQSVQ
ncbi:TRAP transporter substrate-binding protein [Thermoanaerobacteraceae bacterium SP2]|nr:TRAP transporter substrate-binding protein [Thermoanaerobacteraceae bacterium SP2]